VAQQLLFGVETHVCISWQYSVFVFS